MGVRYASWIGSTDAPLLTHIHLPDNGRARGAVVICPPLGKEHLDTYLGMKALAEQLTEHSLMAVRFDYAGLGDSSGEQDPPDALDRWKHSVAQVVAAVRDSGIDHISVVGLRAGALIASSALPECGPIDAVVFWDPILSGRALLREQRALYAVTQGTDAPADPRISIVGGILDPETATELSALKIDPQTSDSTRTLLAVRASARETPAISAFSAALDGDEFTLDGHEAFVTPSGLYAEIPFDALTRMSTWLADGAPANTRMVDFPIRHTATVATTHSGEAIRETVEYLGPNDLFALRTHGVGAAPGGPTIMFFGTAYDRRTGPARLWVELARTLAAHGISSVRFDRRGVGDTGTVLGSTPISLYSETSDRDAVDATLASGVDPGNLVVTGLCSGAWFASSVAIRTGARAAVLVNMILWSTHRRKSLRNTVSPEVPATPEDAGADTAPPSVPLRARIKPWLQEYLPYPLWRLLGRFGVTQVPEVMLEALRRAGVPTAVVLSAADHHWFVGQRGEEGLQRLRKRGFGGQIRASEVGDHAGVHRDGREFLRAEMTAAALTAFGIPAPAPVTSESVS